MTFDFLMASNRYMPQGLIVGCFPVSAAGDQTERAFAFDDFGKSQRIVVVWP